MRESHESSNWPEKLVLEEGQRELLCSGDGSGQCPAVNYEPTVSAIGENQVNKAFDLLFQEVMSIRKSKQPHEIMRNLRPECIAEKFS